MRNAMRYCLLFVLIMSGTYPADAGHKQHFIPQDRRKTTTATYCKLKSGKHSHYYFKYTVDGHEYSWSFPPHPYQWEVPIGAKYIIAYDSLYPFMANAMNYAYPIFTATEQTGNTTAKIIQTSFGNDLNFNRESYDWVKYAYRVKKAGRKHDKTHIGYLYFEGGAPWDAHLEVGKICALEYSPGNPARSVFRYGEGVPDSLTQKELPSRLTGYRNKTFYHGKGLSMGIFFTGLSSPYDKFRVIITDPVTHSNFNNVYKTGTSGNIYGIHVTVPVFIDYHKHYMESDWKMPVFDFSLGAGNNSNYVALQIRKEYQYQVTRHKADNKYQFFPSLKLLAALSVGYTGFNYELGKFTSGNGGDIEINGKDLGSTPAVNYSREGAKISPEIGVCYRISSLAELRVSYAYNYYFYEKDGMSFGQTKSQSTTSGIGGYIYDMQGKAISKNLFSYRPFSIKTDVFFHIK